MGEFNPDEMETIGVAVQSAGFEETNRQEVARLLIDGLALCGIDVVRGTVAPPPHVPAGTRTGVGGTEVREELGKVVRAEWIRYCLETGDNKPSHIAPWEELSDWDKEADRRIADAVRSVLGLAGDREGDS